MVCSLGQTVANFKVNTPTTLNTAMASFTGLMADTTEASGSTAANMEKAYTKLVQEWKKLGSGIVVG